MTYLGEMTFFLGMETCQSPHGIFICQRKHANEILKKFNMESCNPLSTPLVLNQKMSRDGGGCKVDESRYKSMIIIRLDLMYAVTSYRGSFQKMVKELDLVQITMKGNANGYPFCDMYHRDMSDIIFKKLGPLNNSLLHVAASSGNEELTKLMADQFPNLNIETISHGDTPLHVAARVGMLHTAEILVDHAKIYHNLHPDEPHPLRMKNNEGNTALHEALLALQLAPKSKHSKNPAKKGEGDEMAYLLAEHTGPEHVCNCGNKANQSPLCLAVEYGNRHFLEIFFNVIPVPDRVDCSATAKCLVQLMAEDKLNLEVLELIHKEKPKRLDARDEAENTLLHSAASTGHLEEVRYLSEIMSDNVLYKNKQGSYAIHVASEKGYVKIVRALLKQWPYPNEILDAEGRSILHVAAKSANKYLVRHILKWNKSDSDMLINMKDRDGNTPLHLAARHGHCLVLGTLLLYKRRNAALKNKTGRTAYDIAFNVVKQSDEMLDEENNKEVPDKQSEKDKHVDAKVVGVTKNEKPSAKVDPSTPTRFGMV
ncbi:protein ACCELERATED CELL DEATH 6-like [Pistacia vera]|uniref:protein ACCELERATED CELL DEATH 6-like n=1 Tax=Pistacia vera TaxID=55513 RepID=UPI0012631FC4|nr:protein ACCELERATED CELL DEATH 6-like [Pistacia vera]